MHHLDPLGQDDMEGTGLSPGGSTVASATLLNSAMAEVLKDFLPVRNPMAGPMRFLVIQWRHRLATNWRIQFSGPEIHQSESERHRKTIPNQGFTALSLPLVNLSPVDGCPLRLSQDGCFLGPFRGKDFCRSFQFCGCRSRWATEAMATRSRSILVSWSHGSWGVLSYALGSKLGLGPKTGSLSRSETIPTCKATIMFEPYPNSCTVLEGR